MKKLAARKLAKNIRNNISKKDLTFKTNIIINKIINDKRYKEAKIIGLYYPINNEIDISNLPHPTASFAFPVIRKDTIEFFLVNEFTKWKENIYGIKEPVEGKIVNNDLDILFVPALAKNNSNYRIGYGKGYYDKFLSIYTPKLTIGLIYDNIELDFPNDKWDIAMDEFISN